MRSDRWASSGSFAVSSGGVQNLTLTVDQIFPLAAPASITWTAAASGGTAPLQYKFLLYDRTSTTWTVIQDWSLSGTVTWTPGLSDYGIKALQVWVRSTGSTADYDAWLGTGWFLIGR